MTGLSRRQHFIEILVSKPDWDTCGVAFRKLVRDPLGQAHMRPAVARWDEQASPQPIETGSAFGA